MFAVISVAPGAFAQCVGGYLPTCSLTKAAPVFLGTLESMSDGVFHFRVEERFAGVRGGTADIIDIAPVEGSTGYTEGAKRCLEAVFRAAGSTPATRPSADVRATNDARSRR
jgi:hypothetical protein